MKQITKAFLEGETPTLNHRVKNVIRFSLLL